MYVYVRDDAFQHNFAQLLCNSFLIKLNFKRFIRTYKGHIGSRHKCVTNSVSCVQLN